MLRILGRELIVAAARRRTYIGRVLVVLVLLAAFGMAQVLQPHQRHTIGMLGHGRALVLAVAAALTLAVVIVLPATTASDIATEREQGTLMLLLLTPTSPTNLMLQKFLSQVAMAGALCLLASPLLTMGYAYGGVSGRELDQMAVCIGLLVGQSAAIGVAAGYVLPHAGLAMLTACGCMMILLLPAFPHPLGEDVFLSLSPLMVFDHDRIRWQDVIGPLALILVLLLLARVALPRTADPSGTWGKDRLRRFLSRNLGSAPGTPRRAAELPADEPVRWLEHRTMFGRQRPLADRLLWVALPATMVVIFTVLPDASDFERIDRDAMPPFFFISALTCMVLVARSFAGERGHQRFELLLTTGLPPQRIIREKMAALLPIRIGLACCLALPLLLQWSRIALFDGWDAVPSFQGIHGVGWMWVPELILQLSIASWLTVLLCLWQPSPSRRVILSIGAVVAYLAAGPLVWHALRSAGHPCSGDLGQVLLVAFSPCSVFADPELRETPMPAADLVVGFACAAGLWFWLRNRCGALAHGKFGTGAATAG